ncbi:MAG: cupin domain-containing protein [Ginsengibacter sp.]
MKSLKNYIESGILELYVLGMTNAEESAEVQEMAMLHEEVRAEIDKICVATEAYAQAHAIKPTVTIRPLLMASIDYSERLKNGEPVTSPPVLHNGSAVTDYNFWLNSKDAVAPENFENIHARLIGYTHEMTTAIIWVKDFTPPEIHINQIEKFLIVRGTCEIVIGKKTSRLVPGDFLSIPLFISHHVKVTSIEPCVIILQRTAA